MDGFKGIVLSGDPKAGKTTLVERLKRTYPWEHFSAGTIIREEYATRHPEKDITFDEFYHTSTIDELRALNERAAERFAKLNVIGESRVAIYCEDLPLLLVYLTADLDIRARRALNTSDFEGMEFKRVREFLRQRQEKEVGCIQELFGYDYRDPKRYHLVFNTGRLSVDEELSTIKSLIPIF